MKQKAKESNTVRYPVTFPNTLHTAIKAIAADTDTSMNAIIINVLQDWIAQRRHLAPERGRGRVGDTENGR